MRHVKHLYAEWNRAVAANGYRVEVVDRHVVALGHAEPTSVAVARDADGAVRGELWLDPTDGNEHGYVDAVPPRIRESDARSMADRGMER